MPSLSIWEKESFYSPQDIIIAGSGFTGLWSALQLKIAHPQYKITILESGLIPTGASTRNAGFSCFGSPSELIEDALQMGEEKMWKLVAMRYSGLNEIRKYFTDAEIDYDANSGFECFTSGSKDWHESYEKLGWLNEGLKAITGKENIFTIADEKLAPFGFAGFDHLIENKLEGGLHPGKLVQALLLKIQGLGVQVLTGMEIINYEETADHIDVVTAQVTLSARQLLICTNAFTRKLVPAIDIIPNRGQVLITAPIHDLPFKGTFHFNKGYYYFRNLGNRLLIGGARNVAFSEENTDEMDITTTIQTQLENFVRQHLLPSTPFTITDRWSGIMAMGSEKSPIVQAISDKVFCCVRMSGMGVALAPALAKEITGLMNKRY